MRVGCVAHILVLACVFQREQAFYHNEAIPLCNYKFQSAVDYHVNN
jgi:hypothetical protein